jgi:hypothetical protein
MRSVGGDLREAGAAIILVLESYPGLSGCVRVAM